MTPFLAAAIAEMLTDADELACRACGFEWALDVDDATHEIVRGPAQYERLLRSAAPEVLRTERGPVPTSRWSPSAYVWHVGDVTRAWAERLHSLHHAPEQPWAGFDPDALAQARHYDELPAVTGPWALEMATTALHDVFTALGPHARFQHPEWGAGSVADALRWVAHEVVHHQRDVALGLDRS